MGVFLTFVFMFYGNDSLEGEGLLHFSKPRTFQHATLFNDIYADTLKRIF